MEYINLEELNNFKGDLEFHLLDQLDVYVWYEVYPDNPGQSGRYYTPLGELLSDFKFIMIRDLSITKEFNPHDYFDWAYNREGVGNDFLNNNIV